MLQQTGHAAYPPGGLPGGGSEKKVRMAPKLAFRNLIHDRLSLFVTLVGIVFSVVLVAVQFGLFLGMERTIGSMFDQAKADLWIIPISTKSFDDPTMLQGREKYTALATPGVADTEEMMVGYAGWRKPTGGTTAVLVVGTSWQNGGLKPWNIVEGSLDALAAPNAVAADKSYFRDLAIEKLGDLAEINNVKVNVTTVTNGIRSFTTQPYIFMSLERARTLLDAAPELSTYVLVRLKPEADVAAVQKRLAAELPNAEIITHQEFRKRSIDFWVYETGAGSALIAGSILGLIVGVVIVAQTLYAKTKDHINEFATLRALGASSSYIYQVILIQAMLSAAVGFALGISLALFIVQMARDTTLVIVMTPGLAATLFALTIGMCAIAAMSAIFKVTRIDPAGVFNR